MAIQKGHEIILDATEQFFNISSISHVTMTHKGPILKITLDQKSDTLQYNTLETNDSSTKCLTFQVLFFS